MANTTSHEAVLRRVRELEEEVESLRAMEESSRDRWHAIALASADQVLVLDANLKITFANRVEPGLTIEDVLGKPVYLLTDDLSQERVRQALTQVLETGRSTRYYTEYTGPDGDTVHFESMASPVRRNGRVDGLLVVSRDISDRKRGEFEQLHQFRHLESLERIERVIRQANDVEGMLREVLDTALSIFESDRAWLLYPCDPSAPSWSVPMERTAPEYPGALAMGVRVPMLPEARAVFEAALETPGPVPFDSKSGRELPPEASERFSIRSQFAVAVYPRLGKPWLLGMHDCSRPRIWSDEDIRLFHEIGRRMGDSLTSLLFLRDVQVSEAKYRELVEGTSDLIARMDSEGVFTFVNHRAREVLGLDPSQCIGLPLWDFLHPADRERSRAAYESWTAAGAGSATIENRSISRAGDIHELLWTINIHYGDKGRGGHLSAIARDVGDLRRAERERLNLERQVQHAQKLESLGVLAGGIAHDFNNLLMGVLGNTELALLRLPVESPARENLRDVQVAAVRAAELAKQMLAYSGKGHFVVEPIRLNKVVEEMLHLLGAVISKTAVIKLNLAPDLPSIEADVTQLRQVIMNLITNASEAVGERSGVITVTTGVMKVTRSYLLETHLDDDLPEGHYAFLEVADTGCGMDSETRSKVFDPFFTTKFAGRGLGLAAVLGIVRGHHGAIKIYSEPGKGTTFKALFPCVAGEPDASRAKPADMGAWRGRGTILLVDDEESVRSVGRRALEHFGFEVRVAGDGLEAVELLRKHAETIAAVVLDMTMPRMGGDEAFREMRRIRPDIRVILSSGYNEQDATSRFAGKGLAGFIQKPYRPTELMEKLRQVLGQTEDEEV